MQKIFYILLFIFPVFCFAQSTEEEINFEYQNLDLKSTLKKLENESNFHFYYIDNWLEKETTLTSNSFTKKTISDIINTLLKDTNFNYFIDKNKIILVKNSFIYTDFPNEIIQINNKNIEKNSIIGEIEKPDFEKEYNAVNEEKNELQFIGKEQKKQTNILELKGYIVDNKKNKVSNVLVSVKNKNINTTTNNDGFYSLKLNVGLNIIEVESMLYKKYVKNIIIYDSGELNIKLEEKINVLDEVVINKTAREKIKSTITGVTTIDIENIKNIPLVLGERDIFKVASILPGIKTTGEGSAGYNVRGGKEDQNLILLDNALIYNPSHFFGFFSAVNPFAVKKVDIYKGSIPAEFGGRLSSVFDITTKKGNVTKISGEGGIGPVTSNFMIEAPIVKNKSSLYFAGRATYSDWILRSLNNEKLKKSKAAFYDATLKYDHTINENNSLSTTLYYSKDNYSISTDSVYDYSNKLVSINWNHNFNEKLKSRFTISNSDYNFNIDYEPNKARDFKYSYSINETQLTSNFNYKLNSNHNFVGGFNSKLYQVNPGEINPVGNSLISTKKIDEEKALESGLYLSDNITISKKIAVNIGVRYSNFLALGKSTERIYEANLPLSDATVTEVKEYDNNEVIKSYSGFEPRISARYNIKDDLSVKISYDKTNQYIHLLSNNTTQSPIDTWKLSGLNIKPQVAEQFSIGVFKNYEEKGLEFSVEGYYKKTRNFLDYKVGANIFLNQTIETQLLQGLGKAYGVEFLLKKNEGKLNGWIGYTYSRAFVKLDGDFNEEKVNNGSYFPTNFDKPHDLSVVLNYKLTKRFSFSGNFIYQTGRPITYPVGSYVFNNAQYTLYSDRNKFRIPDYYRLDLGFNIEGNHKIKKLAHSFVNISVYNVLGINNPYSIFFVTNDGKIKAYKTSIFAIPIPTITYNFKF